MPSLRRLSLVALGMGAAASPLGARMNSISQDEPIRSNSISARQGSIASDTTRSNSIVDSEFERLSTQTSRSQSPRASSPEPVVEEPRDVDHVNVPEAPATSSKAPTRTTAGASKKSPASTSAAKSSASSTPLSGKKHVKPNGRKCGTGKPDQALLFHHKNMQLEQRAVLEAEKREPAGKGQKKVTKKTNVQLYFHVVETSADQGTVTKKMVANQLGMMQQSYAAAGISFTLAGVDYTVNDAWAGDQDSDTMKSTLRKGGYSALNIYFQSALSSDGSGSSDAMLLGYCTMPTTITYSPCTGCATQAMPQSMWASDGCNVHAGSMPGGALDGYNMGKTAVHESGHWFGLFHTFEGESCDASNPGDYIDDTPQESVSTNGCPAGKDSCTGPNCPGLDPIHNFMDYSDDACYTGFTKDQITRMNTMYSTLRKGL